MSEISNAIQDKCLAFADRVIKLNDYLLEQAANKHQPSAIFPRTSALSHLPSDLSPQPSDLLRSSFGVPLVFLLAPFG